MCNQPLVVSSTPQDFAKMVETFTQRVQSDETFANLMSVICGSNESVQAFLQTRGVGISQFARLMSLPPSTIRHYQRLGLVNPYEVNGKFRFWFHNVIQVESVRQWRDLGLSLEEIQAQQAQDRLGGQTFTVNANTPSLNVVVTEKTVSIAMLGRLPANLPTNLLEPNSNWSPLPEERVRVASKMFETASPEMQLQKQRLLAEVRDARQNLEKRLKEIKARVARAKRLEAILEQLD